MISKKVFFTLWGVVFLLFLSSLAYSADIHVANSEDWKDVYSVMLKSSLEDNKGFFLNSDTLTGFTEVTSRNDDIFLYESNNPYINNLDGQLSSVGYTTQVGSESSQMNLDLDPRNGKYYVISSDNPRVGLSLAPLAIKENAWVFIVDDQTAGQIANRLEDADSVIAVGNFKRTVLEQIEDTFTEWIDNDNLYANSQELADRFGVDDTVILADGSFLEVEFFSGRTPVVVSGHNKILNDTYSFLKEKDVSSVVIVGNKLSTIGEQIRSRSNKEISIFIKFGQSDTSNTGTVYALTMYPLPKPTLSLTVSDAIYDPENEELIARFRNLGSAGVYEVSSITVKSNDVELVSASDDSVRYLASGETLPVSFNVSLSPSEITNETMVEFYTSFGVYPSQLESFLTMENKFGPPFAIPLTLKNLDDDNTKLEIEDVAYYKSLNRIGISLYNNGSQDAYVSTKIHNVVINGIEQTLYKESEVQSGKLKTVYVPASLDKIDIEDNDKFSLVITYGANKDLKLKSIRAEYPFKIVSGINTTMLVGAIVVVLLLVGTLLFFKKKKSSKKPSSGASSKKKSGSDASSKKESSKKEENKPSSKKKTPAKKKSNKKSS
ncbi:MAG: hypothetical protein ACQESC_01390 [Nanobdellota archaeon]